MNDLEKNIIITDLKKIKNINGEIMHILKSTDKGFFGFGEVYFSKINFEKIKGWKMHTKMIMNLVVPLGLVKFVFYDEKKKEFVEKLIGEKKYNRITVQPNIWFAFQGLHNPFSLILNLSNIKHDPNEQATKDIENIKYKF